MYGVRQEIEAVKFLLSSFFGRPDEAERFESIKVKAASNESIKVYAGFSMVQLQEQLVVLQNQLFGE